MSAPETSPSRHADAADPHDRLFIAGAGIGGLTAALCLAREGRAVTILERAETLAPVGSGLQLSPNAMHVLRGLGLEEELRRHAVAPEAIRILSGRSGKDLARIPLGAHAEARYGAPYLVIHRGNLQETLLRAARACPDITLRLGADLRDARQSPDGVTLDIETAHGTDHLAGAALIGADGVWSVTRRRIMGLRQAVFSGRTAYRAVIPIDGIPEEWRKVTGLWLGADAHVVHYPLSGGRQFNIVALVKEDWHEETWSAPAARADLLARFAGWPRACRALLEQPESWLKWALCGMEPGMSWINDRFALLGDAAHAMLPFAAQGAAMSIEDGAAIARNLARIADPVKALKGYQSERQDRAERVLRLARSNDRVYHLGGPLALARDAVMRSLPPQRLLARFDWLYGWRPPE